MSAPAPKVDDVLLFDFGSDDNKEAKCPDGIYRFRLDEITMPKEYKNSISGKAALKSIFRFVIIGEADKFNRPIASEWTDVELAAFVNIEARGEKATLFKITSALLGEDPRNLEPVKPSQLIGRECWGKVSSKANDTGDKIYTNIDDYMSELPKVAAPPARRGAGQPAQPTEDGTPLF